MKRLAIVLGLPLLAAALPASAALEGFALWDNYDAGLGLSGDRWLFPERVRMRENGVLRFVQRDFGLQLDNTGLLSNSYSANLGNADTVTQMRAQVTVSDYGLVGCAANSTNTSNVMARLQAEVFNAAGGTPTSRIGNVGASFGLERNENSTDGVGVMRVIARVYRCTQTDCNYGTESIATGEIGTVTTGQTVTLKFDWEPEKDRFNFYRDSDPVLRLSYAGLNDSTNAFGRSARIGTRTSVANCFTGPRDEAWIDAGFDNVSTN